MQTTINHPSTRFPLHLLLSALLTAATVAADWPQWRGPNRDGVCTETNLLDHWPADGPRLLWEMAGLGTGYSSVAIVDGRLYTMGDQPAPSGSGKTQNLIAIDLATHKQLWAVEVGPPHRDGPRSTPTVDNGRVYAIGTSGNLVCVDARTGQLIWKKNLLSDLGGSSNPTWKFSESPLVDGEKLLCTPGGRNAVIAALDKNTGQLLWKTTMPDIGPKGRDQAGYSSIVVTQACGLKQYVQLTNKGLIGVDAASGRFLWGYNRIANRTANISTPVVDGPYVFCSTAYGTGSALLELTGTPQTPQARELYFLNAETFQNHHGGFVRVGRYIYGGHGHNRGKPTCIEMKTGKILWQAEQPGSGSAAVLYADGHLYFRYQDNTMALIEANPQKYVLKSTFKLPSRPRTTGPGWAHPVIADGCLYIRHADVLFVYDIRRSSG